MPERDRSIARTHISQDLTITGTLLTDGVIEVSGAVEGNICAREVIVNPGALFRGEIVADMVTFTGRGTGRVTARSVRMSAGAQFTGDILHQSLGIEPGAEFEGAVLRKKDDASWSAISKTFEIDGVELTPAAQAAVAALKEEFDQVEAR
ncbi:MAG: polymer-forming cytoskeletal protein [Pseudomonadota bacterium]